MNDFLDIAGIFLIACVPFVVLTVVLHCGTIRL